ncbi:hypothetical protein D6850_02515 [Roseovarius spongiae]|uniref:DUF3551 domain-containing protein n=1 Tax=Roseovarius spongiae TaxID=2320272 RepID=A0A3A8AXH3_9RHOB|nr:hypothetical protein [Roseovarius spongiae]RKF16446.1 hypothetical protein D6850_02515 [Roseovarius spongiae]
MRLLPTLTKGIALAFIAASPAMAGEAKIYPYPTNVNYCAPGYQPIMLNGVICCGQPTTGVTYRQMMRHPTPRVKKVKQQYSARRSDCPVGSKGCY